MENRGKSIDTTDYYCSSSDNLPCKRHPFSSPIGVCAHCLRERLTKLTCSDCGEQRLSSCSCSEISSSYTNSSVNVGSVGRVSFLIENDKIESPFSTYKLCFEKRVEKTILLQRSSSTHVKAKKSNGFWRLGKLFMKKREKGSSNLLVSGNLGVSRSRSLCSFRGSGFLWSEDGVFSMSSSSAARSSSVKRSGFSEADARRSEFNDSEKKFDVSESENGSKGPMKMKESDFMNDSEFINLKLDLSSQLKRESSVSTSFRSLVGDGIFSNGGSCRISVRDRGVKKSFKVWRWLFRPNQHSNCEDCQENR